MLVQFGDLSNKARDHMRELGEDARKMRDDWREIANLSGKSGPDDTVVADIIAKGAKTGMVPEEARKFMEQFQGSIPAGLQKKNIKESAIPFVAEEGMRFGNRTGLAPSTAGDFTGVMAQYGKVHGSVDAAATMGRVAYGLNEGRGHLEPLMRSLIKTAGAVAGEHNGSPIWSLSELAAIQGVASTHASPDASGTKIRKAVSELRDFSGLQGDGLKRLGIKPTDSYLAALNKIRPGIMAADASGKGGDQYLMDLGFNDLAGRTSLVEQARDYPIIMERIKNQKKITGEQVQADNENYLNNNINGISRKIKGETEAGEYIKKVHGEKLAMANEAVKNQMTRRGEYGGFVNETLAFFQDFGGLKRQLGFRGAKERWLDERSMEIAHETAYRRKINEGKSCRSRR